MDGQPELTSAQTISVGASRPPSSSHTSRPGSADEGRFIAGTLLAGRYRIVGLLGRGGMGEVYRATDLTLGQSVALKFLPVAAAENRFLLERFHGEVRIARQISHPNVCRIYDIGETEGMPFLSMEYVDGEDLASLLPRIGRLPADRAVETARKICAGLAAAHSKGVIHRDLKPHNIMMDKRGEIVIMDFGLAAIADQLSGPEVRDGTPAYMSPEQLKGTEVTARSDIYALGLVMYEIFTGRRPYDAKNVRELISLQESAQLTAMSSIAADIDPAVEQIIRRCLDPDPAKRPDNALSVSAVLPGGDPLAAALAAGQTPSPELVAASGKTEGMALKYSLLCVAIVLATVVAVPLLKQRKVAFLQTQLDYSPDVLKQRAREMTSSFGYSERPADTAIWLNQRLPLITYLDRLPPPRDWKKWLSSEAPAVAIYRESLEPLVAEPMGNVTETNPPVTSPGSAEIQMDAAGRLRGFQSVPSTNAVGDIAPVAPEAVFRAAGFDPARFNEVVPTTIPTAPTDVVRAWKGVHPAIPNLNLQVEMGWWKGKLTYVNFLWPWTTPAGSARTNPTIAKLQGLLLPVITAIGLLFAILLARRNWKRERADRHGAFMVGLTQFGLAALGWGAAVHVVASISMLELSANAFLATLAEGAVFLVLYLALEPALRLRWPHSIITWNRVLAGRWLDAQVCSHILVGLALGSTLLLGSLMRDMLAANTEGLDTMGGLYLLNGTRFWIAGLLGRAHEAINTGLTIFFVIFGLRTLLRRDWIAALAAGLIFAAIQGDLANSLDWRSQFAMYFVLITALVFVLLRLGLLVTVTAIFALNTVNGITLGTDWTAWYAPTGFATIGFLLVLTLLAFRQSLGNRELLGT
jgi:serine/threonine protein kinase